MSLRGGAGSDDHRFGAKDFFRHGNLKRPVGEVDTRNSASAELRSKALRLLAHMFD